MTIRINFMVLKGILFATLSVFLYFMIPSQIDTTETNQITARTFPSLIIVLMFICSIVQLLNGLFSKKKVYIELNKKTLSEWKIPIVAFAFLIIYLLSIAKIGFLIATIVASVLCLFLLKCKKWHYYVVCIVMSIVIFIVFTRVLGVYLPTWSL